MWHLVTFYIYIFLYFHDANLTEYTKLRLYFIVLRLYIQCIYISSLSFCYLNLSVLSVLVVRRKIFKATQFFFLLFFLKINKIFPQSMGVSVCTRSRTHAHILTFTDAHTFTQTYRDRERERVKQRENEIDRQREIQIDRQIDREKREREKLPDCIHHVIS